MTALHTVAGMAGCYTDLPQFSLIAFNFFPTAFLMAMEESGFH